MGESIYSSDTRRNLTLRQGPKYTYIWAGSNFICVIWFYLFVPETKGRSLEELDEIFEAKIAARKFTKYKCQIVEDARHDVYGGQDVQQTKNEA